MQDDRLTGLAVSKNMHLANRSRFHVSKDPPIFGCLAGPLSPLTPRATLIAQPRNLSNLQKMCTFYAIPPAAALRRSLRCATAASGMRITTFLVS